LRAFHPPKIDRLGEPFADSRSYFIWQDRVGALFRNMLITFVTVVFEKMLFFMMSPIVSSTFDLSKMAARNMVFASGRMS